MLPFKRNNICFLKTKITIHSVQNNVHEEELNEVQYTPDP